jgi:putative MATE family efflux protein
MIGMPIGLILFLASSSMQASGNTVVPMVAILISNMLNMVLDPLFIFGWGWIPGGGVAGAAWATILAQVITAVGLIWLLFKGRTNLYLHWPDFKPIWRDSLNFIKIGLPSVGQMSSRSLMNLVFFGIIAKFGTFVVAGYGIGSRWHMVLLMPCFVLGNATATMVGQNLGAGQPLRARRAAWCSWGMISLVMAGSALLLYMFVEESIAFFDSTPEVVEVGVSYLCAVLPFYVFTGISIVTERALSGAGCTVATMVSTIIALWGVQVPLALLLSGSVAWTGMPGLAEFIGRVFDPSTQGVWWAMNIATLINMAMLTFWFSTGRWMSKEIG